VDFEAGYVASSEDLCANAAALAAAGAVGVNFEDANPKSGAMVSISDQAGRIAALKHATNGDLFVNARIDVFLKEPDPTRLDALVDMAIERGRAYAEAGADGFFIPGTQDPAVIGAVCKASQVPVNFMSDLTSITLAELAAFGVKRVCAGPAPWFAFTSWLTGQARRYQ
jgi:2-methylisocitrate lyase-like PEP mutase family enzyme